MTITGNNSIFGTNNNDTIIGGQLDDFIRGNDGDDLIEANQGKNTVFGDAGNDTMSGGTDNDYLNGGEGEDSLDGFGGDDTLRGGAGNDILNGGAGNDMLNGEDGDDLINAGDGDDAMWGGTGKDVITGGAGDDEIKGGAGDDIIYGDNYVSNNSTVGENLVANGSFEDYTVSYNNCYQTKTLSGWTTEYASGIDIKKNNNYYSAADGNTWLELEGYRNSSISQQIDTETGKQYQISFDYKGHSQASAYNNKIEVYWNGELIDTVTEQGSQYSSCCYSSCNNSGSNQWKTYTYTLEAGSGDLTGLTFKSVGGSYKVGGQLDNVEVREVYQDSLADKLSTEQVTGNDLIYGEDGNDRIYGGAGWDTIYGGAGNDTINCTDSINIGYGQEDRINGGLGSDTFVLGDSDRGYYNAQGWADCVVVEDFNEHEDKVQLNGSIHKYWLGSSSDGNSYLYEYTNHGWEGVAMFEDVQLDRYDLKGGAFEYV